MSEIFPLVDYDDELEPNEEYSTATNPQDMDYLIGLITKAQQAKKEIVKKDTFLDDVENRLDVANLYKQLLKKKLFDNDNSPAAQKIEERVRGFIKEELKELLGFKPKETQESDIAILLKELMTKIENKELVQKKEPVPVQEAPKVERKMIEKEINIGGEKKVIQMDPGQTLPQSGSTNRIPPPASREEAEIQMATFAQQTAAFSHRSNFVSKITGDLGEVPVEEVD